MEIYSRRRENRDLLAVISNQSNALAMWSGSRRVPVLGFKNGQASLK